MVLLAECETAFQPVGAELRLPVIQPMVDYVDAQSEVVLGNDLGQRRAEGEAALLAEQRHPVRRRADVVAVGEGRQTAGVGCHVGWLTPGMPRSMP